MSHFDLPQDTNFNFSSGIDQLFLYVADQVPIFFPTVLVSFFLVVSLGGLFAERRTAGVEDFLKWGSIAGVLTLGLASIMGITSGLINGLTLVITTTVTMVFVVAYLFNTKD